MLTASQIKQFFRRARERWSDVYRRVVNRLAAIEWTRHPTRLLARISTQLYTGIGAAVALTFVASLVGWVALDTVGDAQSEVNETSLPQLAGSFAVAQQGSALAVAAPRLASAATHEDLIDIQASIRLERQVFETRLSSLTSQSGERFDRVRIQGGALITNLDAIEKSANRDFALRERALALRAELDNIEPAFSRRGDDGADALRDDGRAAVELLSSALNAPDPAALRSTRGRFELILGTIGRASPSVARLNDLGLTDRGVFELRGEQLVLGDRQQALLNENRRLSAGLLDAVEVLVSEAQESALGAAGASQDAIATGRLLLVVINGVSVTGALLIAWIFVGRLLLPRLQKLSNRMRGMADGDLEAEINIAGRDEVAEMAAALEVFRRHALEVQRLNLVEKLAGELRVKNEQLETALEELRRAQNQIVAREKLAGLGELTAGVAHEIRNPLNFVFNFSEAAGELVQELREELEEHENEFNPAQKELLRPICGELEESLERVRAHGGRADRIVRDMLKMGGTTGERQIADINGLVKGQIHLALQTLGVADAALDIEQDLDPDAGQVEVVPPDMGRVLQNLIANARHAAGERRRAEEEAGNGYDPVVLVTTRRLDACVEIRVRDNGTGIPDDVVDKIFNPFFTTKPTDEGTGLGLSLCNDIVRGHGGSIRVDTKAGSHTEMIVELPVSRTALLRAD